MVQISKTWREFFPKINKRHVSSIRQYRVKPLVHKKSGSFLHTIFQTSSFSCGCLILLTSSVKILCGSFLTKYSNALLKNGPLQKSIAFCCDDHAKASSNQKKQSCCIIASCKLIFKQCLPFVFADRWEMHFSTNVLWTNYFVKFYTSSITFHMSMRKSSSRITDP